MGLIGLSAALTVAVAIVLALALQALVERVLPPERARHAQETVGALFSEPNAALYGVLIAFLLANGLINLESVRTGMAREADAQIELARIAHALPEPAGSAIRRALEAYVRSAANDEWPRLREGEGSSSTTVALANLWTAVLSFAPATAGDTNLHAKAIDWVDLIGSERRLRLLAARRKAPAIVWAILILGGTITLGLATISALPARGLQRVLLAALAAMIGLALFGFATVGRPFHSPMDRFGPSRVEQLNELIPPG